MTAGLRPRTRICTALFFLLHLGTISASAGSAGAALGGRVLDPSGRPVPNAEVSVSGATAAPLQTRANGDGRYAFTGLSDGHYEVRATAPGLTADPLAVDISGGTPATADLTMRISALSETLVVSSAQIDLPLSRTPDSVTVIPGQDLTTRQVFSLGSALAGVPGLTVVQSGGPGTIASLFTRGGESDFTLVLVDGVRANAFGGGLDLSQVPLQNVERIEVVRGPQSALYGSDAIGGVIQVITRQGGRPAAQLEVEGGGRDTHRVSGAASGQARDWRWQAGADYYRDAGFTGLASNGETVANDDAREAQVSGSLGWRHASSGGEVQGSVRYVDTDRGSPGPYGSDPAGRFTGVDHVSRGATSRTSGGIRWVQPWFGASSRVRQRVELDVADQNLTFTSPYGASDGESRRVHARVQTDAAAATWLGLSGGVEWLGERGASTYIVAGGSPVPVERGVIGVFGEARWSAGDRVVITTGLRSERIERRALPGDPSAYSPRPDFPASTVASLNPKVAAAWRVGGGEPGAGARGWTRLHAAAGTGIRPPDAFEIAFTDNPGLRPERSRSAEFGVTQALAGGAAQLDATGFFNTYDDLIVSVGRAFAGSSRYRTDNISNARARGLELSAAWRLTAGISIHGAYTFTDSEILSVDGNPGAPAPYAVGDALLRRPRHEGSFDAAWSRTHLTTFLQVFVRGETLDAEPAYGPTGGLYLNPGRVVANLGASWRLPRALEVFGRVANLLDRRYEDALGYPVPGRTAYIGARFALGR